MRFLYSHASASIFLLFIRWMAVECDLRDAASSACGGKTACRSFGTPTDKSPCATECGAQRTGDADGLEACGKPCKVWLNCVDQPPLLEHPEERLTSVDDALGGHSSLTTSWLTGHTRKAKPPHPEKARS